ncbi:hypothetical protein ACFTAO_23800 [Paenibacillus rhizoplanae]
MPLLPGIYRLLTDVCWSLQLFFCHQQYICRYVQSGTESTIKVWREYPCMIKRTFTNKQALLGITIIIALTLAAAAAPLLSPHNPNRIDVLHKYLPASSAYPLGTDQLGRCVFSRLLYGARYSLGIAVPMMLLLGGIGIVLGTAAAYIGGKVEQCFF